MIVDFADKETARIWRGETSRKFPTDIQQRAFRKLKLLAAAASLQDLAANRSNRLHALKENRVGQHSISINMQWRICFV